MRQWPMRGDKISRTVGTVEAVRSETISRTVGRSVGAVEQGMRGKRGQRGCWALSYALRPGWGRRDGWGREALKHWTLRQ